MAPRGGYREEIHEYTAALLHAKTMVIADIWGTAGSTTLDHRSFELNDELNVVAYDADVAGQLEKGIAASSNRCPRKPRRRQPSRSIRAL